MTDMSSDAARRHCRLRCQSALAFAFCVVIATGSVAATQLVNPSFEDANGKPGGWEILTGLDPARYGHPDFKINFDELMPARAKGGHAGEYCVAFPAEGTWRVPVFGHGEGRGADQPDGKRRGKAALYQTAHLEPGTYRFSAHLRTADGAQWGAAFSLGWSLGDQPQYAHDDSTGIHWKTGLAVKTALVGRLAERGEWWPYSTDPFTLDRAGSVTVWIRFDYVNENQFDARWEVDDAAIVRAEAPPPGGALFGVVKDLRDRPLSDVDVILEPGGRRAATDAYGRFAFRGLPGGRYTLKAEREGYRLVMFEPDPIDVTVDRLASVEVVMRDQRAKG